MQQTLSDSKTILSGVPQGSILGPLLFVININDIPLFLSNTEEVIYADDVTLATICDDVKRIESNLFIDTKLLKNGVKQMIWYQVCKSAVP